MSPPDHPLTVGEAVMHTIAAYGVETVFGIPGTHNLEFFRPLASLGIRVVTTRHEQGAGYAADGWAQRTGLPGVVLTTSGPGLLNVLSAAATAFAESRPMIVLSPGPVRGRERPEFGSLHETKDQTGAAGAVMAWSRRVRSDAEAVETVHDAFAFFASGRPRPVHIEVPLDLLDSSSTVDASQFVARATAPPVASPIVIARAASILSAADRPMIIAGGGATRATVELAALAERLGAPVATTINGKGALRESHPLSLGSELRLAATAEFLRTADVLLIVGSKRGEAELWDQVVTPTSATLRIDIDERSLLSDRGAALVLRGDAAAVLEAIGEALGRRHPATLDVAAIRAAQRAEAQTASPQLVNLADQIVSALPASAVVTGDSSQIVYRALTSVLRQNEPRSFLYMATYATLGYGLPAAIGARIASEDRPVVCVVGDGALMMSVQELVTAAEQGLDLTVICIDNGGYEEIRENQLDLGISPVGVELRQPEWPALARSMGADAVSVDVEGVPEAIRRATRLGGLQFVHVRFPAGEVAATL